jgi:hypothetical protein
MEMRITNYVQDLTYIKNFQYLRKEILWYDVSHILRGSCCNISIWSVNGPTDGEIDYEKDSFRDKLQVPDHEFLT